MSGEVLALVNYYARNGYYRHVQTVCNEVLKKRGSTDPTLVFWRALGMLKEGSVNEAIADYEGIKSRGDLQLSLPVKLALMHAHQLSRVIDGEAVMTLQSQVAAEVQNAPDRARLTSALLMWHLGDPESAKRHCAQLLQMQPQSVPALTLMGWLELQGAEPETAALLGTDPAQALARAEKAFDDALAACTAKKDLEALMGKARLLALRRNHREALEQLNQVIVLYPWFLPALVEKFGVLMAMGDWEQAIETAQRVLAQDANNIEALRITSVFLLSQARARLAPLAPVSTPFRAAHRSACPPSPPSSPVPCPRRSLLSWTLRRRRATRSRWARSPTWRRPSSGTSR